MSAATVARYSLLFLVGLKTTEDIASIFLIQDSTSTGTFDPSNIDAEILTRTSPVQPISTQSSCFFYWPTSSPTYARYRSLVIPSRSWRITRQGPLATLLLHQSQLFNTLHSVVLTSTVSRYPKFICTTTGNKFSSPAILQSAHSKSSTTPANPAPAVDGPLREHKSKICSWSCR